MALISQSLKSSGELFAKIVPARFLLAVLSQFVQSPR